MGLGIHDGKKFIGFETEYTPHGRLDPERVLSRYPPGSKYFRVGGENHSQGTLNQEYMFVDGKPVRKPVVVFVPDKTVILADGIDVAYIDVIVEYKPKTMNVLNLMIDDLPHKIIVADTDRKKQIEFCTDIEGVHQIKCVDSFVISEILTIEAI